MGFLFTDYDMLRVVEGWVGFVCFCLVAWLDSRETFTLSRPRWNYGGSQVYIYCEYIP